MNSIDEMLADAPEEITETWKEDLGNRIQEILDRKNSSGQGRETALLVYCSILMNHFAYDAIEVRTVELFPALLKTVKMESSEKESCLALRGESFITLFDLVRSLTFKYSYCPDDDHRSFRDAIRYHLPGSENRLPGFRAPHCESCSHPCSWSSRKIRRRI